MPSRITATTATTVRIPAQTIVDIGLSRVYLGVTNAFALVRLLPVSDHDKDVEILTLRRQVAVLQRQSGPDKARFQPTDRALLAALLRRLLGSVLCELRLPVRPDTVLPWHRNLLARRHAAVRLPKSRPSWQCEQPITVA